MRIWWRQTTWVVLVPITTHIPSFINVTHTELWIFDFFFVLFVISQSEQICKWGIKYAHSVTTDHVGSTCAPTTHIPSLKKIGHWVLIRKGRLTFSCWRETYIHLYIHTNIHTSRQHDKWKLSGPSSIAGSPQKVRFPHVIVRGWGRHKQQGMWCRLDEDYLPVSHWQMPWRHFDSLYTLVTNQQQGMWCHLDDPRGMTYLSSIGKCPDNILTACIH